MSHVNRNSSPWLLEKFRKVTAFSKAAEVLNSQISQAGKITTNTEKIVRVIMLAIYRGGLAKPAYLSQLINIILKGELEINVSPIGPYLEFSPSDYAGSGNDGFRRWFIDTETLAAIHALNAAKDKRTPIPTTTTVIHNRPLPPPPKMYPQCTPNYWLVR